jgi:C-terminal processing protease CtpA/Prc
MMTVLRALGISVGLALLTASSGFSQESTVERIIRIQRVDVAERGWMGLSVRVTLTERTGGPPDARVRILRIVDGGPASLAGIVPGDVIHSIDGQRLTMERWSNFTDDLRPRVRVRLGMDRGRVTSEVLLTTATRPSLPPVPEGLTIYLDSVRTSFRAQLELARGRWATRDYVTLLIAGDSVERTSVHILDQTRANAVRHRTRPETRERQPESSRDTDGPPMARGFSLATGPGGRMTWVMTGDSLERWSLPRTDFVVSSVRPTNRYTSVRSTDSALPLEYLLLTSVAADSVKSAIVQLREQLNDVHEATRRRELEIVQVVPRRTRGTDLADRELDRLKSDDARVTEELSGLATRLAEIGSVERENRMRAAGDARATVQWSRPVTAHLVGRNFVGGAQFSDMNPELATYFGTDRGVLVIQVLSGTPASEAGLLPGDVVTGVGGSDIEDLRSFRDRLNQVYSLQRGAVLSVIRRRDQLFVTLSR